jgi:MoxR-like ATPase
VTYDDIKALAQPVFRHRMLRNFAAQSEQVTADRITAQLLDVVPQPKSGI